MGNARGAMRSLSSNFKSIPAICTGEMQKANVSGVTFTGGGLAGAVAAAERSNAVGQVAQGCMAQKGYIAVPKEQAEARLAEFAAIAVEKKRREAEAAAQAEREAKIAAAVSKKKTKTHAALAQSKADQ
jgi:hypothetical protein